jgi:predicted nucleic acid-binding protein
MPIIIDTNCLANVFSRASKNHEEFAPVLKWILYGKGMIVYGGSKYYEELKRNSQYLKIMRYFDEVGKVLKGDKVNIDTIQKQIEDEYVDPDFDDPHLPAIVIDTKCKIICTEDKRCVRFVAHRIVYPAGIDRPVFYMSKKNIDLLADSYVDDRLKPLVRINKIKSNLLEAVISKA